MSELKRCPFCGGEARLQKPYRKHGWYVICKNTNCGCRTPFYQHQYTSEDNLKIIATKVWNTRIPMQNIVERLEKEMQLLAYGFCEEYFSGVLKGIMKAIEIAKEEGGLHELSS